MDTSRPYSHDLTSDRKRVGWLVRIGTQEEDSQRGRDAHKASQFGLHCNDLHENYDSMIFVANCSIMERDTIYIYIYICLFRSSQFRERASYFGKLSFLQVSSINKRKQPTPELGLRLYMWRMRGQLTSRINNVV